MRDFSSDNETDPLHSPANDAPEHHNDSDSGSSSDSDTEPSERFNAWAYARDGEAIPQRPIRESSKVIIPRTSYNVHAHVASTQATSSVTVPSKTQPIDRLSDAAAPSYQVSYRRTVFVRRVPEDVSEHVLRDWFCSSMDRQRSVLARLPHMLTSL